jgi:hypothetical protein
MMDGLMKLTARKRWYLTLNINFLYFDGGAIFTKVKQKTD